MGWPTSVPVPVSSTPEPEGVCFVISGYAAAVEFIRLKDRMMKQLRIMLGLIALFVQRGVK